MGMNLNSMLYLQKKGFLSQHKNKILDIGTQNLLFCTENQIEEFVKGQGGDVSSEEFKKMAKRLAYFSTPRPGETTTFFAELTDFANIEYVGFDVCPAIKTEIFDLNHDLLNEKYQNYYDVVLNFGTTEHVFNQWNSFEVMHDSLNVGGVIYCVLPSSGYINHGYYCYTPLFFNDLAKANDYEIVDMFLTYGGKRNLEVDIRLETDLQVSGSAKLDHRQEYVSDINIHAIMRKQSSNSFKCALEVATAHSSANEEISTRYQQVALTSKHIRNYIDMMPSEVIEACKRLEREKNSLLTEINALKSAVKDSKRELTNIYESRSWKITKPLRNLVGRFRNG